MLCSSSLIPWRTTLTRVVVIVIITIVVIAVATIVTVVAVVVATGIKTTDAFRHLLVLLAFIQKI